MARRLDVCIRGGGIVGHAMALFPARERLRVGLVAARPAATAPDVRAYASMHAPGLLESCAAGQMRPKATPVRAMQVRRPVPARLEFRAGDSGVDALAWIVDAQRWSPCWPRGAALRTLIERLEAPLPAELDGRLRGQAMRAQFGAVLDVNLSPLGGGRPRAARAARSADGLPVVHAGRCARIFAAGRRIRELMAIVGLSARNGAANSMALDDAALAAQLQAASGGLRCAGAGWSRGRPGRCGVRRRATGRCQRRHRPGTGGRRRPCGAPLAGQGPNLGLADVGELVAGPGADYWRSGRCQAAAPLRASARPMWH